MDYVLMKYDPVSVCIKLTMIKTTVQIERLNKSCLLKKYESKMRISYYLKHFYQYLSLLGQALHRNET